MRGELILLANPRNLRERSVRTYVQRTAGIYSHQRTTAIHRASDTGHLRNVLRRDCDTRHQAGTRAPGVLDILFRDTQNTHSYLEIHKLHTEIIEYISYRRKETAIRVSTRYWYAVRNSTGTAQRNVHTAVLHRLRVNVSSQFFVVDTCSRYSYNR